MVKPDSRWMEKDIMKVRYNLTVNFGVDTKKADDHWTVTAKPFGWILYAKTEDDALARLNDAFKLFVDGYIRSPHGTDRLRKYLVDREINHTLVVERVADVSPSAAIRLDEMGSFISSPPGKLSISRTGEVLNAAG